MDLSLSMLLVRFAVGIVILGHGAQKLLGVAGGPGMKGWTAGVRAMGFRPAPLWAGAAALTEFAGGAALALGLLSPIVAAFIVADLFVAIVKAHGPRGLWVQAGGYEYPLVLAVIVTAIGLGGPGVYSVDAALGWDGLSGAIFVPLAAVFVIADALAIAIFPATPPRPAPQHPPEPRRPAA